MLDFNNVNILLNLAICFLAYSFLGWIIESIYVSIFRKKMVNSGFLYGPFCPIYGFGALTIITLMYKLKGNYIMLFLAGFVLMTIWEYIVGIWLETTFQRRYWDYSKRKFNIKGYVCLQNSIYWGILAVLLLEFINPIVYGLIILMDIKIKWIVCLIGYTYILVDSKVSTAKINASNISLAKLKVIDSLIEKRKEELRLLIEEHSEKRKEVVENIINSLEELQDNLIEEIREKTKHIERTFESTKSKIFVHDKLNKK